MTETRFALRQKITLMVNRYELRPLAADGTEGELLAFAEQKRMAFKEQVTFYTDAAKTDPIFGFKARTADGPRGDVRRDRQGRQPDR